MQRPILAIVGFGAAAVLLASVTLGWTTGYVAFERPSLRVHFSVSVNVLMSGDGQQLSGSGQ